MSKNKLISNNDDNGDRGNMYNAGYVELRGKDTQADILRNTHLYFSLPSKY